MYSYNNDSLLKHCMYMEIMKSSNMFLFSFHTLWYAGWV